MLPWLWAIGCAAPAPSVQIVAPIEDAVVCGDPLVVTLQIVDFTLEEPGGEGGDGVGHCDLTLNGQSAAMTADPHVEIPDVADGLWQITAVLVNADHSALEPYAGDTVYATVSSDACP